MDILSRVARGPNNNETFGWSCQAAIAEIHEIDYGIQNNRFDQGIVKWLKEDRKFVDFIKGYNIVEYLTLSNKFTSDIITRCPHTFLTGEGETLSLRTFKGGNKMFAPKVVGQSGDSTFNYVFGHLTKNVVTRANFKAFCFDNIEAILPIVIDYALISDINIFVSIEGDTLKWDVIERGNLADLSFERSEITFTKNTVESWVESNTIKVSGITIMEMQMHKNRPGYKIRLHSQNFPQFIQVEEINNATLGDSAEYALCRVYGVASGFQYAGVKNNINPTVLRDFESHYAAKGEELLEYRPIRYSGTERRKRGGHSKSGVDFFLEDDRTLSLKTNKTRPYKVCPPEIGQPSPATFDLYFSNRGWYEGGITEAVFRLLVTDANILSSLLREYVKYLNECDFIMWSTYNVVSREIDSKVLAKDVLSDIDFDPSLLSWTNDFSDKSSVTVKYGPDKLSIGEFQIHSARSSLKFRFIMDNLLKLV